MKVTVGESKNPHSASAGFAVASQAAARLEQRPAALALAFCGGRHDPQEFLEGVHEAIGPVPVVGGAGVGAIGPELLGATGYESALALLSEGLSPPRVEVVTGLERGEQAAGRELGRRLREVLNDHSTVLLFYDSVESGPPPVLHVGSRLMDGLYEGLEDSQPSIIGGGTLADLELTRSFIFDGKRATKHAAVAVVLPPDLQSHTTIMHGCFPASAFLEITRIQGATVLELDHRPALDVLAEKLGTTPAALSSPQASLMFTLGEKHDDLFAPFDETRYVNRMVITANPADHSVTLFEDDFKAGSRVQIMITDPTRMIESVELRSAELLASLKGRTPLLGLYIDCAGRSAPFSGVDAEEAAIVQQRIGAMCPVLGFYSGVEIAPLLRRSRPLDWTGVLTLLTLRD